MHKNTVRTMRWVLMALLLSFSFQGCSTRYIVQSPKYAEYEGEINQHTRLVSSGGSRIFGIITNEAAFAEVCPKGTIVSHRPPSPYQVGTLVRTTIDHIFKLEWNSRVEEVKPNRKIRLRFLDGFFSGGTEIWELEPAGECTRVTHTIIVQPRGFLRRLAWSVKARLKHDKMLEALLENLKNAAEK